MISTLFLHSSGIRSPTNSLLNSVVEIYPHLPHALPNFYWQLVWPNRFTFFHSSQCIFHYFSTKQFISSLTTSTSSVRGCLSFSSFISFSKYSLQLLNTAFELTMTLPFPSFIKLMYCTSFPALSFCLANLYNFFRFLFPI